jgi:group I intron endonuclease
MGYIYKIVNTKSGKFYIGSTQNFDKRFAQHKSDLTKNRHHNIHLQRSWNKHGKDGFNFEVVEECENYLKREQDILDTLDFKTCYNVSASAIGGDLIRNHPERDRLVKEATQRLRTCKKPKPKFGKENPNWRGGRKKCKCGVEIHKINKTCIKCSDKTGVNNSFYGKKHTEEYLKRASEIRKGRYLGNQERPVIIEGIEYKSVTFASKCLQVVAGTIVHRIKSKNPKYINYTYKSLTTIENDENHK